MRAGARSRLRNIAVAQPHLEWVGGRYRRGAGIRGAAAALTCIAGRSHGDRRAGPPAPVEPRTARASADDATMPFRTKY